MFGFNPNQWLLNQIVVKNVTSGTVVGASIGAVAGHNVGSNENLEKAGTAINVSSVVASKLFTQINKPITNPYLMKDPSKIPLYQALWNSLIGKNP